MFILENSITHLKPLSSFQYNLNIWKHLAQFPSIVAPHTGFICSADIAAPSDFCRRT